MDTEATAGRFCPNTHSQTKIKKRTSGATKSKDGGEEDTSKSQNVRKQWNVG